MAGPAFVRSGTRAQSAGAASIAPAKPAVDGANGALLALVTSKNNAAHASSTTGWSKLSQVNSGASLTASLWIAAEGAAAPTFTWSGAAACSAQICYYSDPANIILAAVSVSGTAGSGTTSTHTSTGFSSDANDVLAVYADAAAANTAIATPAGWTEDLDIGSATDAGRTAFGSRPLATTGTASGNISVTGAAAAWVQFQVELKGPAASALQASRVEPVAWLDPPAGLNSSKAETVAWLDPPEGLDSGKVEAVAWLDLDQLWSAKIESTAWLDAPAGADASLIEAVAWLDAGVTVSPGDRRRMSLM